MTQVFSPSRRFSTTTSSTVTRPSLWAPVSETCVSSIQSRLIPRLIDNIKDGRDAAKSLAGVDFLTILLEQLKNSMEPVPKKLDAHASAYITELYFRVILKPSPLHSSRYCQPHSPSLLQCSSIMSPNSDGRCLRNQWPLTSSTKASRSSPKMVRRSTAFSGKSSRRLERSLTPQVRLMYLYEGFCFSYRQ